VLATRGEKAVLVSLARAGTPVGALMRRWAQHRHGLDLPHYTMSIVRGRGIDVVALRYLASRHAPSDIMFVDGWTGKGAIARELAAAVADANQTLDLDNQRGFSSSLAVLADAGECVDLFGTRADYLIPSACLNSTVSGLVSRTVLNTAYLRPGDFHGAKFYRQFADVDVSRFLLDRISDRFEAVTADVDRDWPALLNSDRSPTWTGWAAVEAVAHEHGIDDVNSSNRVGEATVSCCGECRGRFSSARAVSTYSTCCCWPVTGE
jgi:hypothetical protein